MRSRLSASLALVASLLALPVFSQGAADYPNKPVTLVVPFASGGPTDTLGRIIAHKLGERLGQPFIVLNKPGAGGNTGSQTVATAPPDGYTLVFGTVATHAINPSLYKNMPYDHRKDFVPISQVSLVPNVLVVNASLPVKTVPDLVAYLKANPGKVFYATPGSGTSIHLASELFKMRTGTEMTHVPYKGSGPATMDLIGGQAQVFFATVPTILGQVKGDRVRLVATTGKARSPLFPQVPTVMEGGVPNYEVGTWWGIVGPKGLPPEIAAALNRAINESAASESLARRFAEEGAQPIAGTPEFFGGVIRQELDAWRAVVNAAGIKIE